MPKSEPRTASYKGGQQETSAGAVEAVRIMESWQRDLIKADDSQRPLIKAEGKTLSSSTREPAITTARQFSGKMFRDTGYGIDEPGINYLAEQIEKLLASREQRYREALTHTTKASIGWDDGVWRCGYCLAQATIPNRIVHDEDCVEKTPR